MRAFEQMEPPKPDMRLARVTIELLGPVPVTEVTVRVGVVRAGRQTELLEGVLEASGREILRATAWRILAAPGRAPAVPEPDAPPPLPSTQELTDWGGIEVDGYLSAIDWRFSSGAPAKPGPAKAWTRVRPQLVAGETTSPTARVMIVADSGSGVSSVLNPVDWLFINPDLTVLLHRPPAGEWICLESSSTISGDGVGMVETRLSDEGGRLGRALQTLLVAPRRKQR